MPPRTNKARRQQSITYNLSNASARDAFEEELDLEDEQHQQRLAGGGGRKNGRAGTGTKFSLSADLAIHHGEFTDMHEYETPKATMDMINLIEIFGSASLDRDVIESVYQSSNNDFELTMERLMELAATAGESAAAAREGLTAAADGAAVATSPDGGTPAPGAAADAAPGASDRCFWEAMPDDLKRHVFSFLNSRDLARVARTCQDFAGPARSLRTNTRQLQIPFGLGMHGIMAMVAGHPNARAVSLRQWAHAPLSDSDFTALVVALSAGSRSDRRAGPVETLSFKGCRWLSDGHVMSLCNTMQHLKELDLTDCIGITDAALVALAKYQRLAPEGDSSSSDDEGHAPDPAPAQPAAVPAGGTTPHLPPRPGRSSGGALAVTRLSPGPAAVGTAEDRDEMDDGDEEEVIGAQAPLGRGGGPGDARSAELPGSGEEEDDGEELQFDFDAPSPHPRAQGGSGRGGGAAAQADRPAKRAAERAAAGGPVGAGDVVQEEEEEGEDRGEGGSIGSSSSDEDENSGAVAERADAAVRDGQSPLSGLARAGPTSGLDISASSRLGASRASAAATSAASPGARGASGSAAAMYDDDDQVRTPYRTDSGAADSTTSTPLYGTSPAVGSWNRGGSSALLGTSYGSAGGFGGAGGSYKAGGASPSLYGTSPAAAAMVGSAGRARGWLYGSSPVMGPSPFFRTPGSGSVTHNGWLARAASSATHRHSGRGLMSLNLAGCTAISSDGVRALLAAPLPKACLLQLDISRCPRITRAALALPATSNLCVLRAAACHNLHEVVMQLPLTSPLTELSLADCKSLTKLHVVAPALQQLHVGTCRHLNRLHIRCPQLRHLTASLCFRLVELDPGHWEVGRLEHLNLFGCRHLQWPGLAALLARCPALRHLDVNGCNELVVVDVPAANDALQHLDASGCKSLLVLRCPSPALTSLALRSCPRVQEVTIESAALARLDISNCPHLQRLSLPTLHHLQQHMQRQQEQQGGEAAAAAAAAVPSAGGGLQPGALRAAVAAAAGFSGPGAAGVTVRMAGCDRLPVETAVLLKRLREKAKQVAAAAQAAAATAVGGGGGGAAGGLGARAPSSSGLRAKGA